MTVFKRSLARPLTEIKVIPRTHTPEKKKQKQALVIKVFHGFLAMVSRRVCCAHIVYTPLAIHTTTYFLLSLRTCYITQVIEVSIARY